jgi:mono/diheme cytochrome c family protein
MFELTILFSAFATLGGMLFLNNLPLLSHPLDLKERFRRVSDDRFFLLIRARDAQFDEEETRKLLLDTAPVVLDNVQEDRTTSSQIPRALIYVGVIAVGLSIVPFALFAKARASKMEEGRRHLVWDMDFTPSYKAQSFNPLFEDGRSMRKPPLGTVSQGHLNADDHLHLGKLPGGTWATTLPKGVEPTAETMALGKVKFETYCTPCHGYAGEGNGMVHLRATSLKQGWVPPTNLLEERLVYQPAGQIFNTIKNGIRNMPGYASQIDAEERWAVILYLRALQESRRTSASKLTAEERGQLK